MCTFEPRPRVRAVVADGRAFRAGGEAGSVPHGRHRGRTNPRRAERRGHAERLLQRVPSPARVCTEECGTVTKLRCHYHGWTYDLSGNLRGVPEFDGVEGFRREDNGLPPIAVAEWGPFVWVSLTPPREPLDAFLGPLVSWAESRSAFAGLKWYARKSYDLACNWKVYADNYLDGGYHVNTVHPAARGHARLPRVQDGVRREHGSSERARRSPRRATRAAPAPATRLTGGCTRTSCSTPTPASWTRTLCCRWA